MRTFLKDPESCVNLIHVDDAVQTVLAAERRGTSPDCYVVSDGSPVKRGDFYSELARLTGLPEPVFGPIASESTTRRNSGDKRINSRRMLDLLLPDLAYPSYREGLAQIVREDGNHRPEKE